MQVRKFFLTVMAFALLVCGALLLTGCGAEPPAPSLEPSPEQTAAATAAPAPSSSAAPEPFEITESFFDDALFIGDSMTGGLYTTTLAQGGLGKAEIVYADSLGCDTAVKSMMRLWYQGGYRMIPEVVQLSGANKLFLLLCANDLSLSSEELADDWDELIDDIREDNPEVDIYIQSGTPAYSGIGDVNNENILALNEVLKQTAKDKDCVYVDIARGFMDSEGKMSEEYTTDNYVHFNTEGCLVWIEELMDPASYSVPPTGN